jgi:hypothetical protein
MWCCKLKTIYILKVYSNRSWIGCSDAPSPSFIRFWKLVGVLRNNLLSPVWYVGNRVGWMASAWLWFLLIIVPMLLVFAVWRWYCLAMILIVCDVWSAVVSWCYMVVVSRCLLLIVS